MKQQTLELHNGVAGPGRHTPASHFGLQQVASLSAQAQDHLSERQKSVLRRCDRKLRRLAGCARSALGKTPANHGSLMASASMGAGLERQLRANIAAVRHAAKQAEDATRSAQLTARAAELSTHLEMLLESADGPVYAAWGRPMAVSAVPTK